MKPETSVTTRLGKPQLSWEVDGRLHSLTFDGAHGTYCSPDGEVIEMPREGWLALVEAAARLTDEPTKISPPLRATPAKPPKPRGPRSGQGWSPEEDARVLAWFTSETTPIAAIMGELGRNEGGIESRLVRLEAAPDREAVRRAYLRRTASDGIGIK